MADVTVGNSNFKVPDKIGATIVTGAVIGAVGYGLWRIEPILIDLIQNTIYLAVLALVAVLGGSTLWSSREAIWYWQQNQVRKLRRAIIAEDPIGILKSVVLRMQKKEEELTANTAKSRGSRARLIKQHDDFLARSENEKALAEALQDQQKPQEDIEQRVIAAGRWRKAADELMPMIDILTDMTGKFQEALLLCRRSIADAENQEEVMEAKLAAFKDGQQAVKGFRAFFGRNPELAMQREAVQEIELQASQAEASIDQFLKDIEPVLQTDDLQKRADAKAAMAKFGGFLNKAPAALPSAVVDGHVVVVSEKELVRK